MPGRRHTMVTDRRGAVTDEPELVAGQRSFLLVLTLLLPRSVHFADIAMNSHSDAEHGDSPLRLSNLRGQSREGKLRRMGIRLRLGFLVFVGLLSTAVGIGLIAILRDAATSRSVVIDPFDVPAGPATARVNGKIVAAGLWRIR